MENHVTVAEHAWGMKKDPANVTRWKHKFGFHSRGVQWDTPMSKWAGRRGRTAYSLWHKAEPRRLRLKTQSKQKMPRKEDVTNQLAQDDEAANGEETTEGRGALKKKPRDVVPLVLERPPEDKKPMLEIRCDSNTLWTGSMVMPS